MLAANILSLGAASIYIPQGKFASTYIAIHAASTALHSIAAHLEPTSARNAEGDLIKSSKNTHKYLWNICSVGFTINSLALSAMVPQNDVIIAPCIITGALALYISLGIDIANAGLMIPQIVMPAYLSFLFTILMVSAGAVSQLANIDWDEFYKVILFAQIIIGGLMMIAWNLSHAPNVDTFTEAFTRAVVIAGYVLISVYVGLDALDQSFADTIKNSMIIVASASLIA